jgi:hypothetical protein
MARVVILSFKDNAAAERFVELTLGVQDDATVPLAQAISGIGAIVGSSAKVEALVAQPTLACRCKRVLKGDSYKTKRFGWWVHRGPKDQPCNRPQMAIVRNFIKNLYVGYNNLLPEIIAKRAEQPAPELLELEQQLAASAKYMQDIVENTSPFATGGLIKQGEATAVGEGQPPNVSELREWKVRSSDGKRNYTVSRRVSSGTEIWSCDCPDQGYRGHLRPCKHINDKKAGLAVETLATTMGDVDPDSPAGQVLAVLGQQINSDKDQTSG